MKRILLFAALALVVLAALGALFVKGTTAGWWGAERDAGTIAGKRVPAGVIAARFTVDQSAAPEGETSQILFGDLHVHTTYSTDAFQWALPLLGGDGGGHPVADACDYARYCSALDFWAITDHAEASTPLRWTRTKQSLRQCQAVAGGGDNPDLVSFVGFEWTQVGRTPADHYGHKNVIFQDLDDEGIAARPIAASGLPTDVLRKRAAGIRPAILLEDAAHAQTYFDFNRFLREIQKVPDCDLDTPSNRLSASCFEQAATPGELVRRLDEQKLDPLIIPHGSSWGFYTPPGTTWDKSLKPAEQPERFSLIEIYSGHGNSEEYRPWRDVVPAADGQSATCPAPTPGYLPSCWRAGEIIHDRCTRLGLAAAECDKRAAAARNAYANMGIAGHMAVKGEEPEEWLDSGQCNDCFLPPFNHRPGTSIQYGLAVSRFDETPDKPARFRWGFVGSSDNHRARPGTGYKPVDRRLNTESSGPPTARWRRLLLGEPEEKTANAELISQSRLQEMAGFQLTEFERQTSFFLTGGLAAVHAENRSRGAIWNALQRREVYATSGQRILLWFHRTDPRTGERTPMGGSATAGDAGTFEVRAVGSLKQKPGCPEFARTGLDAERIKKVCSGECYNPTDVRNMIVRIEVIRIRPQFTAGEPVGPLIADPFLVHQCKPDRAGCSLRFTDPDYARGRRDAIYYVRAVQEAEPMINAGGLRCERGADGRCLKVSMCYGDYRSGRSDCVKPVEPRAWSSPIYLDAPRR